MRTSGILMPVFSLPSPYGIGSLGEEAKVFIDFLKEAGQTHWQILPLGHTGFGDSPYQSFSSFGGNPYFIDLDILKKEGYLTRDEIDPLKKQIGNINYAELYETRFPILRKAFSRFSPTLQFESFCLNEADWLEDYSLFMAIKDSKSGCDLFGWEEELIKREPSALAKAKEELSDDIAFYKVLQFWFFSQWEEVKTYANKKGIKILGDLPIYVSLDSADVWAWREQFLLSENGRPSAVAGCPPDAFSEDGQLWGNPLYDWDYMKTDGYSWWKKRIKASFRLFDELRIDHFRAFEAFYAVPFGEKTAKVGKWIKGPGIELFEALREETAGHAIIAEDLGFLTREVEELLEKTGFPGMSVLQFGFAPDADSRYLPHNIKQNTVVYTGTHDNNTVNGWFSDGNKAETEFAKNYLRLTAQEGYNWGMMKAAMATNAETCILCMQDFIGLGSEGRINTPSIGEGNWQWRIDGGCLNSWLSGIIKEMTRLYSRLPKQSENN